MTLTLTNTISTPVPLGDVGITLPASAAHVFSDPALLRSLGASSSLRAAVEAGTVTAGIGSTPLAAEDLPLLFYSAGQGALKALIVESEDGSLWRVKVSDLGILTALKIV